MKYTKYSQIYWKKDNGSLRRKAIHFLPFFSAFPWPLKRGNASCVLGIVPTSEGLKEIFEFVSTDSYLILFGSLFGHKQHHKAKKVAIRISRKVNKIVQIYI